jgi:hypothetical protein
MQGLFVYLVFGLWSLWHGNIQTVVTETETYTHVIRVIVII